MHEKCSGVAVAPTNKAWGQLMLESIAALKVGLAPTAEGRSSVYFIFTVEESMKSRKLSLVHQRTVVVAVDNR